MAEDTKAEFCGGSEEMPGTERAAAGPAPPPRRDEARAADAAVRGPRTRASRAESSPLPLPLPSFSARRAGAAEPRATFWAWGWTGEKADAARGRRTSEENLMLGFPV